MFSGPVWLPKIYNGKNKTFFFFDAEGIRQSSAAQERYTLPEANWKQGDFSTTLIPPASQSKFTIP